MENLACKRNRAVNIYRVSSLKQYQTGNSLDDQKNICHEVNRRLEHVLVAEFELVETGTDKEREEFNKIIKFCLDPKNRVEVIVFKSIDRFTRGGVGVYYQLKAMFAKAGIELLDAYGFIQPSKNTLADLGFEYDWSKYSPSEPAEVMQSLYSKEEVKTILTRMLRAEIIYTNCGYATRQAPYGFRNTKIETKDGKRTIRVPEPEEARLAVIMFNLRAEGVLSDQEIVDKVNSLGYQSRQRFRRDRTKSKKAIGIIKTHKLTVKQFQRFITKTEYAGIICEIWTHNKPVKAQYDGLISIETFNNANRGKVQIIQTDDSYQILYNQKSEQLVMRKTRYNPLFPFKELLCPICNKQLMGSAPRSKSGKHIPTYHCGRNHKYWGVNKVKFEEVVYEFIRNIKFSQSFTRLLKEAVLDVWNAKKEEVFQDSIGYGKRVECLKEQKRQLKETIKSLSSPVAIKTFEEDLEKLEVDIALAAEKRNQTEQREVDIEELINYTKYFMEHLPELLIVPNNPVQQRALFSLLFDTMPNFNELKTGTPRLSQCFELNQQKALSKGQLVSPDRIELSSNP